MDAGVQTVALVLGLMLGILALAGLGLLARHLLVAAQYRRAEARGETGPAMWLEEPVRAGDPGDAEEQRCIERWQALLGGRGTLSAGAGFAAEPGLWPGTTTLRAPRSRALIAVLLAASLPAGYLLWSIARPPQALDDPEEVLELVSIDKWADAVSMFEDKLRVRFEYRNLGARRVDAFSAHFQLEDEQGRVVLQDLVSVGNPVAPGKTATWTQTYWASCQQVLSAEAWAGLLQKDLGAYRVRWRPLSVVYEGGEARTMMGKLPGDSVLEFEP